MTIKDAIEQNQTQPDRMKFEEVILQHRKFMFIDDYNFCVLIPIKQYTRSLRSETNEENWYQDFCNLTNHESRVEFEYERKYNGGRELNWPV